MSRPSPRSSVVDGYDVSERDAAQHIAAVVLDVDVMTEDDCAVGLDRFGGRKPRLATRKLHGRFKVGKFLSFVVGCVDVVVEVEIEHRHSPKSRERQNRSRS